MSEASGWAAKLDSPKRAKVTGDRPHMTNTSVAADLAKKCVSGCVYVEPTRAMLLRAISMFWSPRECIWPCEEEERHITVCGKESSTWFAEREGCHGVQSQLLRAHAHDGFRLAAMHILKACT